MAGFWRRVLGRDSVSSITGDGPAAPSTYGLPDDTEFVGGPPTYEGPLNGQPDGLALPSEWGLSKSDEQWLRDMVWGQVVLGQTEPDDVLDLWQDELDRRGVSDVQADEAVRLIVRARREQQASWPSEVARTPLHAAFEELESIGVLARADFACCGTCAASEIVDERDDTRTWRGFLWFHQQDTESLLQERQTYVGYGVFLDAYMGEDDWAALDEAAKDATYSRLTVELMQREVAPVLRRHGIGWEWNGDLGMRIRLTDVDHYVAL